MNKVEETISYTKGWKNGHYKGYKDGLYDLFIWICQNHCNEDDILDKIKNLRKCYDKKIRLR